MPHRDRTSGNRSQGSTERDEHGRFIEDSSDRSSASRGQTGLERDERGRFVDEDSSTGKAGGSMGNRGSIRKK